MYWPSWLTGGDVLLFAGPGAASAATLYSLGLIAVNRISVAPFRAWNVALVVGLFIAAIAVASFGLISFTVAIAIAVAAYAALGIVPAREFYTTIEWPVVVMLACLLPIGVVLVWLRELEVTAQTPSGFADCILF